MAKPINVVIHGDYNDRDVNRAIRDLESLKTQAGVTGGGMQRLGVAGVAMGAALGTAALQAAQAGARMALQFGVDSVKAFMDDDLAAQKLGGTLKNLGLAHAKTGIESFVQQMQNSSAVSDEALRPALDRLLRATKNVTEAQGLLALALDISGTKGIGVEQVSNALAKAAEGNTSALGRLGVGYSTADLKAMGFKGTVSALSSDFAGGADTAASSYKGTIDKISLAFGDLQESFGKGFFAGVESSMGSTTGAGESLQASLLGLQATFEDLGKSIGSSVSGIPRFIAGLKIAFDGATVLRETLDLVVKSLIAAGQAMTGDWAGAAKTMRQNFGEVQRAIWSTDQAVQDFMNGTVNGVAPMNGFGSALGGVTEAFGNFGTSVGASVTEINSGVAAFTKAELAARGLGGSTAAAAEIMKVKWREVAAEITASLDGAVVTMKGKGVELGGALADGYQSRLDAFQGIVNQQVGIVKQGQDALASYAQTVGDTIMGRLDFTTTGADGKPMTPEQIMQTVFGDIANQSAAVGAMGGIITQLPEAFANKLLALPTTFQKQLADFLAAHPEMITQLNADYAALATLTETTLGIPMANAWAKVGDTSAVSMIASAKTTIADEAEAFRKWVRSHLATTITVKVNYDTSGAPSSVQGKAVGGPVTGGTPYIVGEKGPELFVPGASGTIVPNDVLAASSSGRGGVGGSTNYSINVQAGVGDPRQIGQQVVEYIKRFEASNSASWRAA